MRHSVSLARIFTALTVTAVLTLAATTSLSAQRGMGRAGGGGTRGGGMGRGSGMGQMKSSAETVKENLERNDPIAFLLDRKKPLALSDLQKDSLKSLRKEMQHMQEPLFKDMMAQANPSPVRGDMRDGGGMENGGADGGRRSRGGSSGASDTVRALAGRLTDIQDAYRDRARGQLNDIQRVKADSLLQIFLADERKKDGELRPKQRD